MFCRTLTTKQHISLKYTFGLLGDQNKILFGVNAGIINLLYASVYSNYFSVRKYL